MNDAPRTDPAERPAADIHIRFDRARADARVDAGDVSFFAIEQDTPKEFRAFTLRRDEKTEPFHRALIAPERWREANDRTRARVFCWTGLDERIIGPVLRHELEHVLQAQHYENTRTTILAAGLMRTAVLEETGYREIAGSPQIYNLNPAELDANGAAARYAFSLLGEEAHRLAELKDPLLDPSVLRQRPAPEDLTTLATRLTCHAAVWAEEILTVIDRFGFALPDLGVRPVGVAMPDPRTFFDFVMPGGQELWDRLAGDAEFQALRVAVAAAIPAPLADDPPDVDVELLWAPAVAATLTAVNRARQVAGLEPTPQLAIDGNPRR